MAPLDRWIDSSYGSTPTLAASTAWYETSPIDFDATLAHRRRKIEAERSQLSEIARHQALLRWRGLVPDTQAN
jgi:hypothetical protein